jgi:cysteinyl-tRNA synthetase
VQEKAALITNFRKEKKFTEADALRKQITDAGYIVQDTAAGTIVKK